MTTWGNYQGYQGAGRHLPGPPASSHVRDARLDLITALVPDIFSKKQCLDVGCNSGNVSTQLCLYFYASHVVGVDIDPDLIDKASRHYSFVRSRVRPPNPDSIAPRFDNGSLDYFPISALLDHGHRLDVADCHGQCASSPAAAQFVCQDWALSSSADTLGPFDVVLALSVIKWIHLEHLDDGLHRFFDKCAAAILDDGYLVIEVQPWTSYERAIKANKAPHFQPHLQQLQVRPSMFTELLQSRGFVRVASSEELPRQIIIYRKLKKQTG